MQTPYLKSATWFTCIGIVAATIHYVVAISLESLGVLSAPYANLIGFLMAFPASYIGHSQFSFPKKHASEVNRHVQQSLIRFFCIALFGFLINQSLVLFSLNSTLLPFWLILGIVMVLSAICTYFLSRYWAFID